MKGKRMIMRRVMLMAMAVAIYGFACTRPETTAAPPEAKAGAQKKEGKQSGADSKEVFVVKLETSKGDVYIEVHPEWAPNGAAHFKELVENKFYDECRFFRVIKGFMAQIGMNGDPKVQAEWGEKNIEDDKVVKSNKRGYVTYAQTGAPNSRSTQFFINYGDNSRLDEDRFAPFGVVVKGMEIVDSLYNGYGEGAPRGRGPSQGLIAEQGNEYLKKSYPKLDHIKTATIVKAEDWEKIKKEEEPKK